MSLLTIIKAASAIQAQPVENVNWQRGLFRLWCVCSLAWGTFGLTIARSGRNNLDISQADVIVATLPPLMVLVIFGVLDWVRRGFVNSPQGPAIFENMVRAFPIFGQYLIDRAQTRLGLGTILTGVIAIFGLFAHIFYDLPAR